MAKIVTLGAGRMGRGIAQVFAYAGYRVTMLDMKARVSEDLRRLRDSGLKEIHSNLDFLAAEGVFEASHIPAIMARISFASLADGGGCAAIGRGCF